MHKWAFYGIVMLNISAYHRLRVSMLTEHQVHKHKNNSNKLAIILLLHCY